MKNNKNLKAVLLISGYMSARFIGVVSGQESRFCFLQGVSMERDFKGVWIPKEIWLDKGLTWMEKLLITELNSLDNEDGCFASNNYLAKFFNLSTGRISQMIKSLKEKNYISCGYTYKKNSKEVEKRVVKILNTCIKDSKGGIKNIKQGIKYSKGGYLENCKDNNTVTNNTKDNNTINIENNGKFKKPSIEKIKEYCTERDNKIDPNQFFDYYESKGWLIGKAKMKDWKAAVRTWERYAKKYDNNKTNDTMESHYDKVTKSLKEKGWYDE